MNMDIMKYNSDIEIVANFKPRARLLLQLGNQLIKNEGIALLELVKNAYDADASRADVVMSNVDNKELGIIRIEDDGFGMTLDVVENVWLEPGSSFKADQFESRWRTPKYNRLPIGEKGIGRFGAHKLGNVIEMTTKSADSDEIFVRIDWSEFSMHRYLSDVPIKIVKRSAPQYFQDGRTGTLIVISQLHREWTRSMAREVKRAITSLTSPFESMDSFLPNLSINNDWCNGLSDWQQVKNYALYSFEATLRGNEVSSFSYDFLPWATMTKLHPTHIDEEHALVKSYRLISDSNRKEIVDLSRFKIGTINIRGYIFDRDTYTLRLGVSDKQGFKDYLSKNCGIRVFRDGLRVYDYGEPENDWLALDYRRFNNPSKAISNNLILGAITLKREESQDLEEKTNREGFVDNDAYYAFKDAIMHVIDLVETLRQLDKKKLKEAYGPTPKSEPILALLGEAQQFVEEKVKEEAVKKTLKQYLVNIEIDYKQVTTNLLKAAGVGLNMSVVVHEIEKIIYEVNATLKKENASERVQKLVKHLADLIDGYAQIIRGADKTSEFVSSVINQALFNVEYRLSTHDILLTREYQNHESKVRIKMPRNLMIASIMNLLDNSIYWLDQKYILQIEKGLSFQRKLWIDVQEDASSVNIIVADNGTGFCLPTDDVVEPFVSGKKNGGGMGLGLHIVSEVLNSIGGKLVFPQLGDFYVPEDYKEGAVICLSLKK